MQSLRGVLCGTVCVFQEIAGIVEFEGYGEGGYYCIIVIGFHVSEDDGFQYFYVETAGCGIVHVGISDQVRRVCSGPWDSLWDFG